MVRVVDPSCPSPIGVGLAQDASTGALSTAFSPAWSPSHTASGPLGKARPMSPSLQLTMALPTRLLGLLFAALSLVLVLPDPAQARSAEADPDPVGVWPLDPVPEVVAGFDPPTSTWGAGHRGVDLLGAVGQPVRAALAGQVSFAGRLAGRGVVVVRHGDTRTTYEPVTATVDIGTAVAAGSRLGVLELPGSHCFPRACLHWGWLRGDTYLDPLLLVGAGPVRLLPLWRDQPVGPIATSPGGPRVALRWRAPPTSPYDEWQPLLRLLRTGQYVA